MELMGDHWGGWCSAGILCYCVILTRSDVMVRLFKYLHKESTILSATAGASHFVRNHAPIVKSIFIQNQCHVPDEMEANLTVETCSAFHSHAEVK